MKHSLISAGIVLASCLGAASASAQTVARPEATVGYQLLHIPDETFPAGFNVDVAGTMNNGWALVGEFGFSKDDQNEPGVTGKLKFLHYGVGPRWQFAGTRARPFAQVLAGGVHTDADTNLTDDSDNAFMLQPGAGVVWQIGPGWGAVGQLDYRRVFFKEEGENEWRMVLGLRFGL